MHRSALLLAIALAWSAPVEAGYSLTPAQAFPPGINRTTSNVAIGDVNGDLRADAVLLERPTLGAMGNAAVMIRHQTVAGSLAAPIALPLPEDSTHALALGDLNRDGLTDIVVGHINGITVFSSRAAAPGQFDRATLENFQRTTSLVIVDVNGDGFLDVVCADGLRVPRPAPLAIFYGDGQGGMLAQQVLNVDTSALSISAGDVNRDGFPDLLMHLETRSVLGVLYHDGVAGYTRSPVFYDFGAFMTRPVLGDVNGDGRLDLIGSHWSAAAPPLSIVLQEQWRVPFRSVEPVATAAWSGFLLSEDLSGDARDDLVVIHHEPVAALGLYVQGAAGLGSEASTALPRGGFEQLSSVQALAAGDVNGDGCKDVALADANLGLVLLTGQGCGAPADLAVAVAGGASSISVGLSNAAGTQSAATPLLRLQVSTRAGVLQTGTLPANCSLQSQSARAATVECLVATLAPGATAALTVPFQVSATATRNTLTVLAQVSSDTPERSVANNRVWKQIVLSPMAKQRAPKATVPARAMHRLQR